MSPQPDAGDFSWRQLGDSEFLADAYKAVEAAGAWEFFATVEPPEEVGYTFWEAPELKKVQEHMKLLNYHSGASFGSAMRIMQSIAKRGWSTWVANQLDPRNYSSG